jgi:hypothetical protein
VLASWFPDAAQRDATPQQSPAGFYSFMIAVSTWICFLDTREMARKSYISGDVIQFSRGAHGRATGIPR